MESRTVQWYWNVDCESLDLSMWSWKEYSLDDSYNIEKAFQQGLESALCGDYEVVFKQGVQRHRYDRNRVRYVKREDQQELKKVFELEAFASLLSSIEIRSSAQKKALEFTNKLKVFKAGTQGPTIASKIETLKLEAELQKMKETLQKELEIIKEGFAQRLQTIEQEVDQKMNDYQNILERYFMEHRFEELEKKKIEKYFFSFMQTLNSVYVTAQVLDSGQLELSSDKPLSATLVSTLLSFIPIIGSKLQQGFDSVKGFLESQEMLRNARKVKQLVYDSSQSSQLAGGIAIEIIKDTFMRELILKATIEGDPGYFNNIFKKASILYEGVCEKADQLLYTNLYSSPSALLGHQDGNYVIQEWINDPNGLMGTDPKVLKNEFFRRIKEHHSQSSIVNKPDSAAPAAAGLLDYNATFALNQPDQNLLCCSNKFNLCLRSGGAPRKCAISTCSLKDGKGGVKCKVCQKKYCQSCSKKQGFI